ncbi:MAG TPA: hypothetical protein VJT32_11430 [bacterium]|nr:hypothetical protein [bacterium]
METEWKPGKADLLLMERPPADRHPVEVYLAERTPRARAAARESFNNIAAFLTMGQGTADTLAWHLLRETHVAEIRGALMARYTATEANRMLAALRGVLRECRRLGLVAAEDYRRLREAAAVRSGSGPSGRALSRGELRSVFESVEDEPPAPERGGAVRTLLYGNGKVIAPQPTPAAAVRWNAMTMGQLALRRAAPREAIAHALWEAEVCLRQWAFCACLAMLRKALDLWTVGYRDKHGLTFDWSGGERDDLHGRLRKIAEENKLYRETIQTIMEGLCQEADDTAHGAVVCRGGYVTAYDGLAATRIKEAYRRLHEMVVSLIAATTPDLPI